VFGLLTNTHAQDIITKKNGDDIKAKVLEVTQTDVKYKRFESLEGAIYTINKSDILMIRYQDGTKDIFTEKSEQKINDSKPVEAKTVETKPIETFSEKTKTDNDNNSGMSMSERGKYDAINYYRKYKGAETGTFLAAGFGSPLIGLIPAISCSSAPPKEHNLNAPNNDLMKIPEYHDAYAARAHRIKKGKTWLGYAMGTVM